MILSILFLSYFSKIADVRYDGAPTLPYYRARDFDMKEEPFSFKSGKWTLHGSRYSIPGMKPKALVVFFHGLGDGRASYVKEISLLVKEGYLVYAYDNTGSMESEGPKIYTLDHSHKDQKAFFAFLDKDPKAQGLRRYAIGHSWGGYNALIASKKAYKVGKMVSLAGFVSITKTFLGVLPKKLHFIAPWCWFWSHVLALPYLKTNAIGILKKGRAKVLYIQGKQDEIVKPSAGFIPLRKAFNGDPRFKFILVEGIGHSVYRAPEAEEYCHQLFKEGIERTDRPEGLEMDISRATKENAPVWKAVFDFLND